MELSRHTDTACLQDAGQDSNQHHHHHQSVAQGHTHLELANTRKVPAAVHWVGGIPQLSPGPKADIGVSDDAAQKVAELLPERHHQVCV